MSDRQRFTANRPCANSNKIKFHSYIAKFYLLFVLSFYEAFLRTALGLNEFEMERRKQIAFKVTFLIFLFVVTGGPPVKKWYPPPKVIYV